MRGFIICIAVIITFAASGHAQNKPIPKPCLTPGCSKITVLYDLGSLGMTIYHATQGQQVHSFRDLSQNVAAMADSSGYAPMESAADQQKFLAGDGMSGCYDPSQKPTPEQLELLKGIVTQLRHNYYYVPKFYWTVLFVAPKPQCLNSFSIPQLHTVFFFTSMGNVLNWNRDAIASVIAHELGHITDKYCETLGANITAQAGSTALQQVCEKHADNIGIQYVVGAGFNPDGFVDTFETLQRYIPTNVSTRYTSSHPINADRITNVGLALQKLCREGIPEACEDATAPAEAAKAYNDLKAEKNPDTVIARANDFAKEFPESPLLTYVYAIEARAYQQQNNAANVVKYGEKSLELDPKNIMSLLIVSQVLPQPQMLSNISDAEREKRLTVAAEYAQQALREIDQLAKQPNESDAVYQKRKERVSAGAYASLGMVHLELSTMTHGATAVGELAKAEESYRMAIAKSEAPNPADYYRLGEVYAGEKKMDDAISAFSKAGQLAQGTIIEKLAHQQIQALRKAQSSQAKAAAKP